MSISIILSVYTAFPSLVVLFVVRPISRSMVCVVSNSSIGDNRVSTHIAAFRKELEEEKPQGSVGRKADCAFMCPIRLDIFLIASLRFSVLFPRFVPKERYAVFILNNEHSVAVCSKFVVVVQSFLISLHD